MALQSDGKIVVGGSFSTVDNVALNGIARINTNGSTDTTFNPGTGANGPVQAVAVQGDGQIIIGGDFNQVNGTTRYALARLTSTGGVDLSFSPTLLEDEITAIDSLVILSNGSIIISGNFEYFDDFYSPYVARILSTGAFDQNFYSGDSGGPDNTVDAMALAPSGQLLIGGVFGSVDGESAPFVARLNNDSHAAFFTGEVSLGSGVYYLGLPDGGNFGEYSYLTNQSYIYSYDLLSYEYLIDAKDDNDGIYLYDFTSGHFFYTSPYFPYPYVYDFTLNSVLYYFQDGVTPRSFYDFTAGQYITQ